MSVLLATELVGQRSILEAVSEIWPILTGIGGALLFLIVWVVRHDFISREHSRRLDEHVRMLSELGQQARDHERLDGHAAGGVQIDFIRETLDRMDKELASMGSELRRSIERMEQVNQDSRHRIGNQVTVAIEDVNERIGKLEQDVRAILMRRSGT